MKIEYAPEFEESINRLFSNHPKYFIPRFFESITFGVYRKIKYFIQRGVQGYSDEDVWGLSDHLAEILPNAIRSLQNGMGYPYGLSEKKWNSVLEEIAIGFESYKTISEEFIDLQSEKGKELWKKWQKGSRLFVKYFPNLWD